MVISEDPDTQINFCWAFSSSAITTIFYDLGLLRQGFEHLAFRLRGERYSPLPINFLEKRILK